MTYATLFLYNIPSLCLQNPLCAFFILFFFMIWQLWKLIVLPMNKILPSDSSHSGCICFWLFLHFCVTSWIFGCFLFWGLVSNLFLLFCLVFRFSVLRDCLFWALMTYSSRWALQPQFSLSFSLSHSGWLHSVFCFSFSVYERFLVSFLSPVKFE